MQSNKAYMRLLAQTDTRIEKLYSALTKELLKVGLTIKNVPDDQLFTFSQYPSAAAGIAKKLQEYHKAYTQTIEDSVRSAVRLSFDATTALLTDRTILSRQGIKDLRETAFNAFLLERYNKGLGLSNRVWNVVNQSVAELEAAISLSMKEGMQAGNSAEEIGRSVRHLLNNPDMMYRRYHVKKLLKNGKKKDVVEWRRRVIGADGKVHFVRQDLEHVGQGVYRSARQNALRLAATETNMAYRYADCVRYQNEPYVLGLRIQLSGNHTLNGKPFHDICDELAGDYPKWFLWKGWHPRCRCVLTSIVMDDDEWQKFMKLSKADRARYVSPNLIREMPQNYQDYIAEHYDKIIGAIERGTQPYWIKDNYVDGDIQNPLTWVADPNNYNVPKPKASQKDLALQVDKSMYTQWQQDNFDAWEQGLGQARGVSMTFDEADHHHGNPHYQRGVNDGYSINCQTCTVAYELRRRGFNVEAFCNDGDKVWKMYDKAGVDYYVFRQGRWQYPDGKSSRPYYAHEWIAKNGGGKMTRKKMPAFFDEVCEHEGRYEVRVAWKGCHKGHVFIAERDKDGVLSFFDPQSGRKDCFWGNYELDCRPGELSVVRIDNKLINPKLLQTIVKKGEITLSDAEYKAKRIAMLAEKRRKARSFEREAEIREFWEKKKAENEARKHHDEIMRRAAERHAQRDDAKVKRRWEQYREDQKFLREQASQLYAKYADVPWVEQYRKDVFTACMNPNIGMKKLQEFTTTLEHEAQISIARLKALGDTIPDVELFAKNYTYDQLLKVSTDVQDMAVQLATNMASHGNTLAEQLKWASIEASRQAQYASINKSTLVAWDAYRAAYMKQYRKLYITSMSEEVKELMPFINSHPKATTLQQALQNIRAAQSADDAHAMETALNELKARKAAIEAREARTAKKKAQKAAKAAQEATAPIHKQVGQCVGIDELRQVAGDNLNDLFQNYEASVERTMHTRQVYLDNEAEISRKLKEMFDSSEFSHCASSDKIQLYLQSGILNNMQAEVLQKTLHGKPGTVTNSYNLGRINWAHYAYKLPGSNPATRVPINKKYWLDLREYYRCGVPVNQDIYTAYTKDASGYGEVQFIFRKERVVTTFTFDNSLGQKTIPSLTSAPRACSLDDKNMVNWADEKYTVESAREGAVHGYIEIQYAPLKNQENFTPRDFKRIVVGHHPTSLAPDSVWEQWAKEGVDIYYIDTDNKTAVLYKKGKPLELTATEKLAVQKEGAALMKDTAKWASADADPSVLEAMLNEGRFEDARAEIDRINKVQADFEARKATLLKLIPDVEAQHATFTLKELDDCYAAIEKTLDRLDSRYGSDYDKFIEKIKFEIDYVANPGKFRQGAVQHRTWQISQRALQRHYHEYVGIHKGADLRLAIKDLVAYKTESQEYNMLVSQLQDYANNGEWATVADLIEGAKAKKLELLNASGVRVAQFGESIGIKFDEATFEQARKDAALWFKDADVEKAFKAADDYMSQYAQEIWGKLTDEEKHVAWLYTSGSRYINEEIGGTYCNIKWSEFDGSRRNGIKDANVLTSIIEKAPRLKDDMWMTHTQDYRAFVEQFGVDLRYIDNPSDLVGKEGYNKVFTSCTTADGGAFATGAVSTGGKNNVVFNIFTPKGAQGIYVEPFAYFGDSEYRTKGMKWTGNKRKGTPSKQVEWILQRGAKFRITKVTQKGDMWYIDVDLIEQTSQVAL